MKVEKLIEILQNIDSEFELDKQKILQLLSNLKFENVKNIENKTTTDLLSYIAIENIANDCKVTDLLHDNVSHANLILSGLNMDNDSFIPNFYRSEPTIVDNLEFVEMVEDLKSHDCNNFVPSIDCNVENIKGDIIFIEDYNKYFQKEEVENFLTTWLNS